LTSLQLKNGRLKAAIFHGALLVYIKLNYLKGFCLQTLNALIHVGFR